MGGPKSIPTVNSAREFNPDFKVDVIDKAFLETRRLLTKSQPCDIILRQTILYVISPPFRAVR
jgi:hypothetical protein